MVPCAAEAHITKIRHDKGLADSVPSGPNVTDLENALETLSEQLYQSSTHFLLELIQNADDNSYHPDVDPSVHFTYSNGHLRVDCNEVGFSPRNVEAICRVGQSTKKGGDNAKRYVGEKGIGFKSVFKAADVVWISSGDYSFKFDKHQQLGMIAPIWKKFPVRVKSGYTSMYLKLSENYNRQGLLDELRSLDSRLLIFLRRLRNITVSISEPRRITRTRKFSRIEKENDIIRLTENAKSCDFIITRHEVSNMPEEPKRQGVKSSEIVLGFPITTQGQPKRESQQAYAFLPIRDYGFEFLIQADFLLIASREDIDDSSKWNHALREALYPAFVKTIRKFNEVQLRYSWPRYLPIREPLQSFLKPFHVALTERLRSEPLLLSQSGDWAAPDTLTYVPDKYNFNGAPLTTSVERSKGYLSARYAEYDLGYLNLLGVIELSEVLFFLELTSLIEGDNADKEFKSKSMEWHAHLATILIRFPKTYTSRLAELPLVPLSNGEWVAMSMKQVLFPATSSRFSLPDGLELLIIDTAAANNPSRRRLFRSMGVGDIEQEPVVQHIEFLHASGRAKLGAMSHDALVSQVKFLYSSGWKNPSFQKFWFMAEDGSKCEGSQLYQDSAKPYSATHFFGKHRHKFHFIHKDYLLSAGKDRTDLSRWLEEKMEVATIPKLIQYLPDKSFKLSEDFEFIVNNFPSAEVLLLLRDNWDEYSKYFDADQWRELEKDSVYCQKGSMSKRSSSVSRVKDRLKSMLVTCTIGATKSPLDATFLPSRELLAASQDGMPFVEIPDPDDRRWRVLKTLDVSIEVDVTMYLRCLEKLSLEKSNDAGRVESLLALIQFRCSTKADEILVKNHFRYAKKTILIPARKKGEQVKWGSRSDCRWKGPPGGRYSPSPRAFHCLKNIYPGNSKLFRDILDLNDFSLNDTVEEVKLFKVGDSLAHITSIFHTMERMMEGQDATYLSLYYLTNQKVFPVSMNWNLDTDRVSNLERGTSHDEWFIADTAPFRTTFAGVVPLLDIKVDDLAAMDEFLSITKLKDRFLSRHVKSVPKTHGELVFRKDLTELFASKVDFIIRLIPTTKTHRQKRHKLVTQLRNLRVYTADEVIQEWTINYKKKTVKGPPGNGRVALVAEDDVLKIYLAAKGGLENENDPVPIEVVDEIFNFCDMKADNPHHSEICLHIALSNAHPSAIWKTFADKGIPSLESLKFTEEEEFDSKEEDEKNKDWPSWIGEAFSKEKKKSKSSGAMTVTKAVLGAPIGLVIVLGGMFQSKKNFDGEDSGPDGKEPKAKLAKIHTERKSNAFQLSISTSWSNLQHKLWLSDDPVAFDGEFMVHKMLSEALGQNYNPIHHWTSTHRSRASLSPFYPNSPYISASHTTFTFPDTSTLFTQLLISQHSTSAQTWLSSPPTYHIDVHSTPFGQNAEFAITQAQFERAKDMSVMVQQMRGDVGETPRDVYILVRVYDVDCRGKNGEGRGKGKKRDESKMVFLVDPWECFHESRLVLRGKGGLVASLT